MTASTRRHCCAKRMRRCIARNRRANPPSPRERFRASIVNWELSAAPYLPIYRRRLWRRRLAIGIVALLIAVPSFLYYRHLAAESIGARVFDDVESSVAAAYYDPSYHGLRWTNIAAQYRPLVERAPDAATRYSALRRMLTVLGDSHTM